MFISVLWRWAKLAKTVFWAIFDHGCVITVEIDFMELLFCFLVTESESFTYGGGFSGR